MSRRTIHAGFIAVNLALLVILGVQWHLLAKGRAINSALERITRSATAEVEARLPAAAAEYAEARLAWANVLSAGGSYDRAEVLFNDLIQQEDQTLIAQAAQFNLANMYLRQAMLSDTEATRIRPLLELAKQRYRDLLGEIPSDWDARFNLERALRLAPENAIGGNADKGDPIKRVEVIVPDFKVKDLP